MSSSFFGSDDKKSTVYKGSVGSIRDCAAGRLVFLSDGGKQAKLFDGANIAVGKPSVLSSFLLSDADTSSVYAAVVIGNSPDVSSMREAERKNLPILTLPSLPQRHNGKIAILDTSKESLFVDPDIDTLGRYLDSFALYSHELSNLCAPISYVAFNGTEVTQKPIGALHVCSAGRRGELRSEDELFDDYRDLCESVRPLCLTLLLCPAYPMSDESKERFMTHLKAIFRASVYGEIRILCDGPCALTVSGAKECFDAIFDTKELLKKAEHEQNTEIQAGLLVSSPLMLCSLDKLPSFDFLCLDAGKLSRLFLGIPARSLLPDEAVYEFIEFLDKTLTDTPCITKVTSVILSEEIKKAIPEKTAVFSGIAEFFVKRG